MRSADAHMHAARAAIASDARSAAQHLRQAAADLRAQAERATGEAQGDLNRTAEAMETLARRVEQGGARSATELDREVARAHQAMALEYHRRATEALGRNDRIRAGEDLRTALGHLEHALRYADHETDQGAMTIVQDARRLADSLAAGTRGAGADVSRELETVKQEIEKLGRELQRPRPA